MMSADARIETDRAERYLDQLCSHLGAMRHMHHLPKGGHGGAGAPRVEHVERSRQRAVIRFADGSWNLEAAPDALVLLVEAEDAAALERLKTAIAARIAKIGRRDGLTVTWHDARTPDPSEANAAGGAAHHDPGRRRRWGRVGWIALAGLALGIHLGLIGSLLGSGRWKGAAADAIIALLALKLVLAGLHARLGRGRTGHG